jgi:hypothetical protein
MDIDMDKDMDIDMGKDMDNLQNNKNIDSVKLK